ncbi:6-carboxytetrahydropterin synthase [Lactobacillus corticis]|uniref:6-carboxy-5,6,7,8-tetrahydropterin synthase n=1 Tax=Lactobacillus corticis TaxID=2201249 RepID=A0A916VJC2_9LACO|nr:6-carboxytetrahydropterin synthase [Lactobacillus corticis]GFZ27659.1 6-pyruvoyl tetrahydropterin synthase [Lactobacillus corticis]
MAKKIYSYRFSSFINASQRMEWGDHVGERYPHTWQVECTVVKNDNDEFMLFSDIEASIGTVLDSFQNTYLNDLAEFQGKVPTTENLAELLFKRISEVLKDKNCHLKKIMVGESPTRQFSIEISD